MRRPGSFPAASAAAARCFRVQLPIMAVAVASSAWACSLWVPQYKLVGAAWSLCLALVIVLVLKTLVLIQVIRADGNN